MKILMVLASDNFRDEEYEIPRAFWEFQDVQVQTVASSFQSVGRFGLKVINDFTFPAIQESDFDAVFFVGGGGCMEYLDNKSAQLLAFDFKNKGKIVGAICMAPRLLLQWGILTGKKCTGWNGDQELESWAQKGHARYIADPVVVDGFCITADGPGSAQMCAEEMLRLMQDF